MTATVKAIDPMLVGIDSTIYPRHRIDDTNVRGLVHAMEAGADIPPIIVDKKSMRVVDGVHRVKAAVQLKAETIDAEMHNYKSEADMLEDAIRRNMHGKQLSPYDQARCFTLAKEAHLEFHRVAAVLGMTNDRAESLLVRKTAVMRDKTPVTLKETASWLAGGKLTKRQAVGNERAGGMRPLFYVNQTINLIKNDLVDWGNENLVEGLQKLRDLLNAIKD